jgi:predicted nucleic acid-binding protein
MIAYVDASVVLRLAFGQGNPLPHWQRIQHPVSSMLIRTECLRAADVLRLRLGLPDSEFARRRAAILELLAAMKFVRITRPVLERASSPMPTALGTLDAIHLVSALMYREVTGAEVVMATHDIQMGIGAQAHGMLVIGTP